VNNAGVVEYAGLAETTPEQFDRLFTVNVKSLVLSDAGVGAADSAGRAGDPRIEHSFAPRVSGTDGVCGDEGSRGCVDDSSGGAVGGAGDYGERGGAGGD
jgi:hypothetical protein